MKIRVVLKVSDLGGGGVKKDTCIFKSGYDVYTETDIEFGNAVCQSRKNCTS